MAKTQHIVNNHTFLARCIELCAKVCFNFTCHHPCPLKTQGYFLKLIPKGLGFLHFWSKSLDLTEQKKRYRDHKRNAKYRGVEFKLTFDEWWGLWEPFYDRRGADVNSLMMCRKLDSGAYEIGNVTIGTLRDNARTRRVVNDIARLKELQKAHKGSYRVESEDDEDGWMPAELKNPYKSCLETLGN